LYSYSSALKFDHVTTIPTGHAKTVRSIAWSPSGKTLATGSFDSNIGIWEQEDVGEDQFGAGEWECMTILEGHETECKCIGYSSTGTLLASCSRDKTVWVWEGQYKSLRASKLFLILPQYILIPISNAWVC
jgi:WD40 repeat protein